MAARFHAGGQGVGGQGVGDHAVRADAEPLLETEAAHQLRGGGQRIVVGEHRNHRARGQRSVRDKGRRCIQAVARGVSGA